MRDDVIARARSGDDEAFRELADAHRRELRAHCYRMLGSLDDAEDALQETFVAAWRGLAEFEGRASVRTWLYTIATRRCLNLLRSNRRRSAREWDFPGIVPPPPSRLGELPWLEPYPDALLRGLVEPTDGPDRRYERYETISLAFITALQVLPARQRAALILRDVLCYRADEVAAMLGTTVESANGLLKRARAALARGPQRAERERAPRPNSAEETAMVEQFVRAYEAGDVDALVALLARDVRVAMPPVPLEWHGLDAVTRFFRSVFGSGRRYVLVPTRANGQPAFAAYLRVPDGPSRPVGLLTITLAGERICDVVRFDATVLPWFGFAPSTPSHDA